MDSTVLLNNLYLLIFKVPPVFIRTVRILLTCRMCSSTDLEKMMMLSMFIRQGFHLKPEGMTSNPQRNIAGALMIPKGMRMYCN